MRAVANLSFLFTDEAAFVTPRIKAAAAAGFKAIECDWPGESCESSEFKEALNAAKIDAVLINGFHGKGYVL